MATINAAGAGSVESDWALGFYLFLDMGGVLVPDLFDTPHEFGIEVEDRGCSFGA